MRHESTKLLQGPAATRKAGGRPISDRAAGSSGAGGTAAAWREETVPYFEAETGKCRGADGAGPVF
jgi:hypothetical protein